MIGSFQAQFKLSNFISHFPTSPFPISFLTFQLETIQLLFFPTALSNYTYPSKIDPNTKNFSLKLPLIFSNQHRSKNPIGKDRCIIYFIRWLTCGWKEAYFIEMFKRHRAAEFILSGIRIDSFAVFMDTLNYWYFR